MDGQSFGLLNYDPRDNLSINIKAADECCNLSEIRREIDTIDHFLIKLMHNRLKYALATLKFKSDGKPIPDNGRIIQQLNQRKMWAEKYGLDFKFIESFFKLMIDWTMSQQITYYKSQKPLDVTTEFKICSLVELKVIEFGFNWIDISHYRHLLSAGYRKARELNEPVLVSFTQKTTIFSANNCLTNYHPLRGYEQFRYHPLSHGFLLAQPSEHFFMLAFGSVQHFDINQNLAPSNTITYEEFHSKVKEVVDDGWKRLLHNAIIENCAEKNCPVHGPILTGALHFDHQNKCQSEKWCDFGAASFVLPRVQFSYKNGNS